MTLTVDNSVSASGEAGRQPKRVLFVNHTASMSGGEMSLVDLLRSLPSDVDRVVASPLGQLSEVVRDLGIEHVPIQGTDGSLKLDAVQTPRAMSQMLLAGAQLRRIVACGSFDLVHANSIRAGLVSSAAAGRGRPPLLVHARDCLPPSRAVAAVYKILDRRATSIVANSEYTARTLAAAGIRSTPIGVVPSPVDLDRFEARTGQLPSRVLNVQRPEVPLLLVAGQITPWKGQDVAIEVLASLKRSAFEAELWFAGSTKFVSRATRFDNVAYADSLRARAKELGIDDRVRFLGERRDVECLMNLADVVLVPSHEEPFGRVVIEAMATGTPVLATKHGGPSETLASWPELLLDPFDDEAWAASTYRLLTSTEEERTELGRCLREHVRESYGLEEHVRRVGQAYLVAGSAAGGRS